MVEFLDYRAAHSHISGTSGSFVTPKGPCPYCGSALVKRYSSDGPSIDRYETFWWKSDACRSCGWWWSGCLPSHTYSNGALFIALLHQIGECPTPLRVALEEVRHNAERLFSMAPTAFEHFVRDILRSFYDCKVVHCGKSHDGGVDLVLLDSADGYIPVQVKRRSDPKRAEAVNVIREFRGALLLVGRQRGILVTTADHFSREALAAAVPQPWHSASQQIDLVDCRRLLDIIQVICSSPARGTPPAIVSRTDLHITPSPEVRESIDQQLAAFAACQ